MSAGPTVTPVTPERLARWAVDLALPLLDGARDAGTAVRLGVDGAVPGETADVAGLLAARATALGIPVLRVRAGDFLHRRSVRLEHGPHDVDTAFERWVDWGSMLRDVLDPLADPAAMTWLPALWDADADRPARLPARKAPPGSLAVVEGPYLLRWELSGSLDAVVHLSSSPAALRRRFADPEDPRPGAWERYVEECSPAGRAALVVRHDHPDRPAVLTG